VPWRSATSRGERNWIYSHYCAASPKGLPIVSKWNIRGTNLFILPDGTQFSGAMQARGVPPAFVALNRVDLKEE
jgi:hypothetical protein